MQSHESIQQVFLGFGFSTVVCYGEKRREAENDEAGGILERLEI